jgi:hypothetical protein
MSHSKATVMAVRHSSEPRRASRTILAARLVAPMPASVSVAADKRPVLGAVLVTDTMLQPIPWKGGQLEDMERTRASSP